MPPSRLASRRVNFTRHTTSLLRPSRLSVRASSVHVLQVIAHGSVRPAGIEIGSVTVWNDFARLYGPIGEEREVEGERTLIEKAIGWKFRHAFLATEAFTHPSRLDMVSFERTE